ncbi:hypothetical protein GWI33_011495, partial [Rhynchophorus ferrugineus]
YALATLTVTRQNTNGIKFARSTFNIRASESLSPGALVAKFDNNRPGHHLKYFVSDQDILDVFALNTLGELTLRKKLDYEKKQEYRFKVFATDGKTNDSSVVNITIENVNEWEPRFRYSHYEFFAGNNVGVHKLIGKVEAADGDRGDKLTLSLSGQDAHLFFITPNGEIHLRDVKGLTATTASLTVTATDSGTPPKKASVPVTVHFSNGESHIESAANRAFPNAPILLASLGIVLLLLSFVVALLVAYICKVKRSGTEDSAVDRNSKNNPMFGTEKSSGSGTASAIGGLPSDSKSRIPSSKVHPAPQPPMWPTTTSRFKKLSWGDKTESASAENLDTIPKALESGNLTVYF